MTAPGPAKAIGKGLVTAALGGLVTWLSPLTAPGRNHAARRQQRLVLQLPEQGRRTGAVDVLAAPVALAQHARAAVAATRVEAAVGAPAQAMVRVADRRDDLAPAAGGGHLAVDAARAHAPAAEDAVARDVLGGQHRERDAGGHEPGRLVREVAAREDARAVDGARPAASVAVTVIACGRAESAGSATRVVPAGTTLLAPAMLSVAGSDVVTLSTDGLPGVNTRSRSRTIAAARMPAWAVRGSALSAPTSSLSRLSVPSLNSTPPSGVALTSRRNPRSAASALPPLPAGSDCEAGTKRPVPASKVREPSGP